MSALEPHSYRRHWPLLIVLVLSAILRLWQLNESLWLDELHTAWVVSEGPLDIFERARIGNHSPVCFFLPWIATSLLGMSEWALRLPSLLAGLVLVVAVYGVTFSITRSVLGAVTASLLASFDNNFLFYATEARPYACVQLVAVVQLVTFWRLQSKATIMRRAAFVLSTCLLFYLHYTAILMVSGELVAQGFWAWLSTSFNRQPEACASLTVAQPSTRRWLAVKQHRSATTYSLLLLLCDLILIVILMLPALFHLAEIASRRENWGTFVIDTDLRSAAGWFSLVSYIVTAAIAVVATRLFDRGAWQARRAATSASFGLLLTVWFVTPVLATWLATVTDVARLYFTRYLIGIAVAPMLLAGVCVGGIARQRWRFVAMVAVVGYAFHASTTAWHIQHHGRLLGDRNEDWMSAISWLNYNYDTGPVFVRSGLLEADNLRTETTPLLRQYCLCPVNAIYSFKDQDGLIPLPTRRPGALNAASLNVIQRAGVAWFVINAPADSHEPIRQQVFATLKDAGLAVTPSPSNAFGSVTVWRIEVE